VRFSWAERQADEPPVHGCEVSLGGSGATVGLDVSSRDRAFEVAAARAVERFLWLGAHALRGRLRVGSVGALNGRALALDSIAGYSPALRARQAARLAWTTATEFAWTEARSLTRDESRWIPLQLVAGDRGVDRDLPHEPELRPGVPTGIRAHADRRAAVLGGLLDVVERDAFMLTWLCRLPVRILDLDGCRDESLRTLGAQAKAVGLDVRLARLSSDVPLAVVAAIAEGPSGAGGALGVAARASAEEAATAALIRALTARRLGDRDRAPRDRAGRLHGRLLARVHEGRRPELERLFEPSPMSGFAADPPCRREAATDLDRLLAWFRQSGEEVIVADLTDQALASRLGHHVVAVVVPGFHPLYVDAAWPARWSHRLRTVPTALGLPLPALVNPLPHPLC
jgi:ribosomal protein S12 methylthiotransferase accessory factor